MSTVTTKRRKIRPGNAIAVAKLENARLKNKESSEKTLNKEKKKRKADNESVSATKKTKTNVITPAPKVYSSASDSDETDDERRTQSAKKVTSTPFKEEGSTTAIASASASDSDETDDEIRARPAKKANSTSSKAAGLITTMKKKSTSKPTSKKYRKITSTSFVQSDPDSDETDKEPTNTKMSASDSDETDKGPTNESMSASNSDDTDNEKKDTPESDSDSDSSHDNSKFAKTKVDRSHLVSNRISFRKINNYKDKLSPANNVKNRLSDLFVPEVNEDYFISDSDSETDSGDDYDAKEYPSWQRTLSAAHNKEKDPWPKQRKLGYSDKLKLEKRVKKICRREELTFDQVREIFSSSQRGENIRLFQKIAKVFPNMSLHRLAKICKEMYHQKRNTKPWTDAEIKALEELIKIHGNNATLISEHLNRSPKNINDFLYSHQTTSKKTIKRWTKEEDKLIAREAAKVLKKDGKISFHTIVPLFKGTRTQRQVHTRYRSISNLIQPDGTLAEKRKATLYEELKYLKNLLAQVRQHRLVEESQVDFVKDRGFVDPKFYLRNRADIKGFERMAIKEILHKLIEKQQRIIESRKAENLLESEPESA